MAQSNHRIMVNRRTVPLLIISVLIGAGLGLLYGWVLNPIQPAACVPGTFRSDYRTEYVLMVAESYAGSLDSELALQQLMFLEPSSPEQSLEDALEYALASGLPSSEQDLIHDLANALHIDLSGPGSMEATP